MLKISGIKQASLNGKRVKLFSVRKLIDGCWVFVGEFSAPAKTADRDIERFYLENHSCD